MDSRSPWVLYRLTDLQLCDAMLWSAPQGLYFMINWRPCICLALWVHSANIQCKTIRSPCVCVGGFCERGVTSVMGETVAVRQSQFSEIGMRQTSGDAIEPKTNPCGSVDHNTCPQLVMVENVDASKHFCNFRVHIKCFRLFHPRKSMTKRLGLD